MKLEHERMAKFGKLVAPIKGPNMDLLIQLPLKAQRNVFAICRVPDRTTGFMSTGDAFRPCI